MFLTLAVASGEEPAEFRWCSRSPEAEVMVVGAFVLVRTYLVILVMVG
jgi:hypothetical protein